MDEAFIIVSIISGIFGIVGLQLLTHNWFRKERFKLESYNMKKQNDLQLKKMARDLGLSTDKTHSSQPSTTGQGVGSLLDLAKNLDPSQIQTIIQALTGGSTPEYEEAPEDDLGISSLIDFAKKNPELIKGFMDNIKNKSGGSDQQFM